MPVAPAEYKMCSIRKVRLMWQAFCFPRFVYMRRISLKYANSHKKNSRGFSCLHLRPQRHKLGKLCYSYVVAHRCLPYAPR